MTNEKPTKVGTAITPAIVGPKNRTDIDIKIEKTTTVVTPTTQAIIVPQNLAVIDAKIERCTSKNDTNVPASKYECEIQDTAVTYVHGNLSRVSKLTLKDLITGNYTIRLTIEEAEGVYN